MINCHLTGGGHEKSLILQSLSHTSTRQENFCRGYLANRMWFSVVCTLKDNDTRHYCGQNVLDSRGVISDIIIQQIVTLSKYALHTAAEPAVRLAVKILVSQRNDTIKAFFFAANKNKNSAQVPLASTSS